MTQKPQTRKSRAVNCGASDSDAYTDAILDGSGRYPYGLRDFGEAKRWAIALSLARIVSASLLLLLRLSQLWAKNLLKLPEKFHTKLQLWLKMRFQQQQHNEQKTTLEQEEWPKVHQSLVLQRQGVYLMVSLVSVSVEAAQRRSYGEDLNLVAGDLSNSQNGLVVTVEDQEVGLSIRPFAKFSLN